MNLATSFADRLTSFGGPAGGGAAIGAAAGYLVRRDASYGDYVGRGTGLGAIFGLAVTVPGTCRRTLRPRLIATGY